MMRGRNRSLGRLWDDNVNYKNASNINFNPFRIVTTIAFLKDTIPNPKCHPWSAWETFGVWGIVRAKLRLQDLVLTMPSRTMRKKFTSFSWMKLTDNKRAWVLPMSFIFTHPLLRHWVLTVLCSIVRANISDNYYRRDGRRHIGLEIGCCRQRNCLRTSVFEESVNGVSSQP